MKQKICPEADLDASRAPGRVPAKALGSQFLKYDSVEVTEVQTGV